MISPFVVFFQAVFFRCISHLPLHLYISKNDFSYVADIEKLFIKTAGNYFESITWESSTKACQNYVALIQEANNNEGKYDFKRKFLKNTTDSGSIVFSGNDLQDGSIVEIKNVYKKGSKESIVFHGFFSLIYGKDEISGKRLSKEDIYEYFSAINAFNAIENPHHEEKIKNEINMHLSSFLRKLKIKYNGNLVDEVLLEKLSKIIPEIETDL